MTDRFTIGRIGRNDEWGIIEHGTAIGNALWLPVPERAFPFARKVVARLNGASLTDVLDGKKEGSS
jgi:hypothetical protein